MVIYDIVPPEKAKRFLQQISGFKEYKTRAHKFLGIGWRFALLFLLILLFSTGVPSVVLNNLSRVFSGGEYTATLYTGVCQGDWEKIENLYGPPEVSSRGNIDFFSTQNSAIYLGGPYHLVCGDFTLNEMEALEKEKEEKEKARQEEERRRQEEEERRRAEAEKEELTEEHEEICESYGDKYEPKKEKEDKDEYICHKEEDEKGREFWCCAETDEEDKEDEERSGGGSGRDEEERDKDEDESEEKEEETDEKEEDKKKEEISDKEEDEDSSTSSEEDEEEDRDKDEDESEEKEEETDEKEEDKKKEEISDKEEDEDSSTSSEEDEEEADEEEKEEKEDENKEKDEGEEQVSFFQRIFGGIFARADNRHTLKEMKEMEIAGANIKFSFALGERAPDIFFEEKEEDSSTSSEEDEEEADEEEKEDEDKEKEEVGEKEEDEDSSTNSEQDEEEADEEEKEEKEARLFRRIVRFFNNALELAKRTIIGVQQGFAQERENTESGELFSPDTKGIISYTLDGREWRTLDIIAGEELSNALNGGYFTYNAPFLKTWEDVENLQISIEGVSGGQTSFTLYLDSVWVEVNYQEKRDEEEKYVLLGEKDDWMADETPTYRIVERERAGILGGGREEDAKFQDVSNIDVRAAVSSAQKGKRNLKSRGRGSPGENFIIVEEDNFSPGKHTLEVEFEKDGEIHIIEKDFTWGVLAINFDKSIYTADDREAYIQMGVLDDEGHTICNARLEMVIKNEELGINDYLSTEEGTIEYSGVCAGDSYVEVPDYFARYKLSDKAGEYKVELTAHTRNGTRTVTDSFVVEEDVRFDIKRIGPTRIYPPADYDMEIIIVANEQLRGDVTDIVPSSFEIKSGNPQHGFRVFEEGQKKKITWQNLKLDKGESVSLKYTFNAPNIAPEFYLLGPLEIGSETGFFSEKRMWQIASDDPGSEEELYPTDEITITNLSGDIEYLQYDPTSANASNDWYTQTAIDPNVLHVEMDAPSGHISGEQTLRFLVRRTNNSTRTPSITIELRQDGNLIETLVTERDIDSTTGNVWMYTFDTEDLDDISGENLEIRMEGTRTGGPPADRNVPEYGAIEWEVNLTGIRMEEQPEETVAGEIITADDGNEFPSVFVGDNVGNPVEGVDVTVSVSGTSFTATSTTTVESGADGIAEFDNLVIETAGNYQLTFTGDNIEGSITSSAFDIIAADADNFYVENQPEESVAGETVEGPPRVKVEDEFGNDISGIDVSVEVGGTDFTGESTTTVETNENGLAIFNNLVIETAGNYQLTFSVDGIAEDEDSNAFDVIPADPDSIVIETQPEETVAGESLEGPPTVSLEDEFGNAIEEDGFDVSVIVSETDFTGGSTTTVETNEEGLAIFNNLIIETAGNYQLTFTIDGVLGSDEESNAFDVIPADPDSIVIETQPQETVAGESIAGPPTVSLEDEFGNAIEEDGFDVSVTVSETDFTGGSTTTVETNEEGLAIFNNLVIETAGNYQLTFTIDGVLGSDEESNAFDVIPADPDSITIEVQPQDSIFGETVEGPPRVRVEDEFGNVVSGVDVDVEIDGETDFAGGSTTAVETDEDGLAVFNNLIIEEEGIFELVFSIDGFVGDVFSDPFEVEMPDIEEATITVQPQNSVAGEIIGGYPAIYLEDQFEDPVVGIGITASVEGANFTQASTTTVQTGVDGVATFDNLIIEKAGEGYQITFYIPGFEEDRVSNAFDIAPAEAGVLIMETNPQDTVAGEVIGGYPAVQVTDEFGNIVEEEDIEVTVTVSGTSFTATSTLTAMTNENGIATFNNLVIEQAGVYELELEAESITGDVISSLFEIEPADPDSIVIETHPGETVAGESLEGPPTVSLEDEFGNAIEEGGTDVSVEVSGTDFAGGSTTTVETNEEGLAIFNNLVIETAGNYQLTFTIDGVLGSEEDSNAFDIVPADPYTLTIETQPQESSAGEALEGPPAVEVEDEFGNLIEGASVDVDISGTAFTAESTTTVETDEDGVAEFDNLVVEAAGERLLVFTVQGTPLEEISNYFLITPGDPDDIIMVTQPQDAVAGEVIGGYPTVRITDEFGNIVEEEDIEVTVSVDGADFTGASTTTVNTNISGVATFDNLAIEQAGVYDLEFEAEEVEGSVFSNLFEVEPADPDSVSVEVQPEDSVIGGFIFGPPSAIVEDEFENPVPGVDVMVDIYDNEEVSLGGATVVKTNLSGIAEFENIYIEEEGEYQLAFSVDGIIDDAISEEFLVRDRLYPVSTISTSNLSGVVSYLQYDPNAAEASNDWYEANSGTSDTELHVRMDEPPGHLSGTQTFRFLVRRTDNSQDRDPDISIDLYQDGDYIDTLEAGTAVESAVGEVWTYEFEADVLDDVTGRNVEIVMSSANTGGGPNSNVGEYGAIEWEFKLAGISVTVHPQDTVAGEIITGPGANEYPTVVAEDDVGNPIVGIDVTANLLGGDFASGTTLVPTDENGEAEFDDLIVEEAGSYRIIFNAEGIFIDGVSDIFEVEPADPDDIVIEVQPQDTDAGDAIGGYPRVSLEDEFGNAVAGEDVTVSIEIANFAEGSTTTVETNSNGVAIFNNLIMESAGTNRLIFETEGFEGEVYSDYFEVFAGDASDIAFYEEPQDTVAGEVIGGYPAAVIVDDFGNQVEVAGVEIEISVEGTSFASGTTTRSTNLSGVATFHNLVITEAGVYELEIESVLYEATALSSPFEIEPADPHTMTIVTQPTESVMLIAPIEGPPTVSVEDEFGNLIEGAEVEVSITNDMFEEESTTQVNTNESGEAVFNNLIVSDGGNYQLTFSTEEIATDEVSDIFYVAYIYDLTVTSNTGGSVDVVWSMGNETVGEDETETFMVREDLDVTITANSGEWYTFDGWTGDSTSENEEIILTMDDDKSVTANFREIINIAGVIYSDDGSTVSADEYTIRLAIDGASIGTTQAAIDGSYQFLEVDAPNPGDYITVFIDEDIEEGESGVSVTRNPDERAHIMDLDIYQNRVIVREEDEGGVNNTDLNHFTHANIPFSITGGDLAVSDSHKLIVWEDSVFIPGGEVELSASESSATPEGDLEIQAGAELNIESNDLTVGGSFTNSGIFTATESQDTYFIAESLGHTLSGAMTGVSSFGNIYFDGEDGGWTFSNDANIRGDFNIDDGTVTAPASLTVGGSWNNSDTFNNNSGTVTMTANSPRIISANGTENSFYNLTLNNAGGTWSLQDNMEVENSFNIDAGIFNAGSNTIILSGSGTPLLVTGTFNEDTSTVSFEGTGNSTIPSTDYYNLQTSPSSGSPTYTLSAGTFSVSNDFYLLDEGGSVTLNADTNNATVVIDNDFNVQNNQTFSASNSLTIGGSFYNNGTFTRNTGTVTFVSDESEEVVDGGSPFYNIVFNGTGSWFYADGSSTEPNSTVVENGEATFLNAKTGTPTVNGGTLLVDWYLGVHLVARGHEPYDIDSFDDSITVSENSTTPQETVFRHDGTSWGTPSSEQVTDTGESGINPQPNSDGAIRIREYEMTSTGTTAYLYNLEIDNQEGFIFYDYYLDHGENYITSENFGDSAQDDVIGEDWYRENPSTVNGEKPYSGANNPPLEGTWYVGMESDLTFTAGADVNLGELNEFNVWTAQGTSTLTVSTTFPYGYTVFAWGDYEGRMKMEEEDEFIDRWDYENSNPGAWDGICDADSTKCGFGYTTDADNLPGGTANRFTDAAFCGAQTGEGVEGDGRCWAGFDTSSENASPVAYSGEGDEEADLTEVTYRISTPALSMPGGYSTTIFYMATVNY